MKYINVQVDVLGVLRCDWAELASLIGVAVTPVVGFLGNLSREQINPNPDEVRERAKKHGDARANGIVCLLQGVIRFGVNFGEVCPCPAVFGCRILPPPVSRRVRIRFRRTSSRSPDPNPGQGNETMTRWSAHTEVWLEARGSNRNNMLTLTRIFSVPPPLPVAFATAATPPGVSLLHDPYSVPSATGQVGIDRSVL